MKIKVFIKNLIIVLICILLAVAKAYLVIPVFLISVVAYYLFLEGCHQ